MKKTQNRWRYIIKNTKRTYVTTLTLILLSVFMGLYPACSLLTKSITISSTGQIDLPLSHIAYHESEIRAVFLHAISTPNTNWNLVTQTLADYGINVMIVEALGANWARYPSQVIPFHDYKILPNGLEAAHTRGIKYYVSMDVMMGAYEKDGQSRRAEFSDGTFSSWLCPTKQASRQLLKTIVQELFTRYPAIDGFMFDYMRYEEDVCYCSECRAKFISDTGLTDVNWPSDVVDGGRYRRQYREWRTIPVTELVRDMRDWMLAIKPNLEFSLAGWSWPTGYPSYWREWIGQDTGFWVKEGWLDWVAPMIYGNSVEGVGTAIDDWNKYVIGGPEGNIPIVPFLATTDFSTNPRSLKNTELFRQQVEMCRTKGADGFAIWRYGGPGDSLDSENYYEPSGDIRDYLSLIDLPPVFTMSNLHVSVTDNTAAITWQTDLPTTSKVEYSSTTLFNATFKKDTRVNQNYWDIDYTTGIVAENLNTVTSHRITLTGLLPETKYYFRVQSRGSAGTITSKVSTFTTGS